MDKTYRIDANADPDTLLEASAAAETVLADQANTTGLSGLIGWLTYLFALGGAAAVMMLTLFPYLASSDDFSDSFAMFISIAIGVFILSFTLNFSNKTIATRFARAWCADPANANNQITVSSEAICARTATSETRFDWAGVTRIEVTPKAIVVISGFAWMLLPMSGFDSAAQAKDVLDDMRRWHRAAQPS